MRKLFIVSLSLIFFISACGTSTSPTPTNAPTTVPATSTTAPTETPTNVSNPPNNSTQTPTQTGSGSPAGCTEAASFVADVTVPDYTHFDPRETFTKTWRIKNTGTCNWDSSYTAVYVSGDNFNAPNMIAFTNTAPGATLDISAAMTAPPGDGKYKIFYQLEDAAGKPMIIDAGNTIWAIITVGKVTVNATPTTTVTPVSAANSTPGATGTAPAGCVTQSNVSFASQTLSLINAARATNGLPALTLSTQLAAAAQAHSMDMACTGNLSHTGSDGSTPASRIAAAGYSASITRENIYAQPPQYGGNPESAMAWWMNSQIHRDAILNAQVTQVGVGYASYAPSPLGGYFTVDFGAP
jgi:uncharacterized protein YkwD